jgi:hypothetical protein
MTKLFDSLHRLSNENTFGRLPAGSSGLILFPVKPPAFGLNHGLAYFNCSRKRMRPDMCVGSADRSRDQLCASANHG